LEVPKEVKGTYQLSTKGKSILYFDLEDGCFASAEQALVMSVRAEMPMPDFTVKGKKPPKDLPKVQKMAMDSDNLIRVTRRGK
jgi:hypothetical protein